MSNERELEAGIEWYENADWGNEDYKDGVVRGFQAGAEWQRAQQSAQAGYVMVPVEPTPEMRLAGKRTIKGAADCSEGEQVEYAYKQMLAAAPKAEPVQEPVYQIWRSTDCSLPKAQAIIDQQAALLKEALKALDNVGLIDSYIDFDSVHATKERLKAAIESVYTLDELTDQQAARIAELQKDADRYRWLEANSTYGIDYRQRPELTLPIYAPDHREGLDAAIDAAMGSKGE